MIKINARTGKSEFVFKNGNIFMKKNRLKI